MVANAQIHTNIIRLFRLELKINDEEHPARIQKKLKRILMGPLSVLCRYYFVEEKLDIDKIFRDIQPHLQLQPETTS